MPVYFIDREEVAMIKASENKGNGGEPITFQKQGGPIEYLGSCGVR